MGDRMKKALRWLWENCWLFIMVGVFFGVLLLTAFVVFAVT